MIQKLPLSAISRMKLEQHYIVAVKKIRRRAGLTVTNDSVFYPLVRSNRYYGNEFLLKKYSGADDFLYAIIEHGLFFGNNKQKVGPKHEWELGSILTYGDYRKELISRCFPEYFCETIGPLIHYASVDMQFLEELEKAFPQKNRTMLFFPVHGSEAFSPVYDAEMAIRKIRKIADSRDCGNILICVFGSATDMYSGVVQKLGMGDRIRITTCGNRYSSDFLNRQKTMISFADETISNSLGTHLGYCIYLGKPHVLLPQDFSYEGDRKELEKDFGTWNRSENWASDFEKETALFQKVFDEKYNYITEEQKELCEYYWGFSKVKTPEEIREIYRKCRTFSESFVKKGGAGVRK